MASNVRHIYVIGSGDDGDPVKIGVANDITARLKLLQTGSPKRLRALHSVTIDADLAQKAEAACHRYLRQAWMLGEWFGIDVPSAMAAIQEVIENRLWERARASGTKEPGSLTIDDQIAALAPLSPGQIAELAGYSSGSNQLTAFRGRGSTIPAERLRVVARRLREIAEAAEEIAGR